MRNFRWVYRPYLIYPTNDYKTYRLITQSYWIVNELGDFLFWGQTPQCNKNKAIVGMVLNGYQKHLDEPARIEYVERAWVPLDPKDWT